MNRISRAGIFFRQFSAINAIRLLFAEFIRVLCDPHSSFTYSQTGEDRIIQSILGNGNAEGFFVDVGCNHPQSMSNTFDFYKRGWTGICIDANVSLIKEHRIIRPRDRSFCAAVSNQEAEMIFTQFSDSAVSSLSSKHVEEWKKIRDIASQSSVRTETLNKILESAKIPYEFSLLSIDVEGHDFEVLLSIDLSIYKPKLIVIEMHGFEISDHKENEVYKHLMNNGYKMIGYVIMNGFFERCMD
jgi:FkbM family methyltransferase